MSTRSAAYDRLLGEAPAERRWLRVAAEMEPALEARLGRALVNSEVSRLRRTVANAEPASLAAADAVLYDLAAKLRRN